MSRIFYTMLEVSAGAVFLIPVLFLWNRRSIRSGRRTVLYGLFSLYLAAVYVLVGMPNVTYIRLDLNLNAVPLLGFLDDWKNSLLNVLLFIPLGVLLPVLWPKYRKTGAAVRFGFGMSLAIELLQILTFRATDVNDLITNVLGTLVGASITNAVLKRHSADNNAGDQDIVKVCAVTAAVMFFLQPFVYSLLWDLLFH